MLFILMTHNLSYIYELGQYKSSHISALAESFEGTLKQNENFRLCVYSRFAAITPDKTGGRVFCQWSYKSNNIPFSAVIYLFFKCHLVLNITFCKVWQEYRQQHWKDRMQTCRIISLPWQAWLVKAAEEHHHAFCAFSTDSKWQSYSTLVLLNNFIYKLFRHQKLKYHFWH